MAIQGPHAAVMCFPWPAWRLEKKLELVAALKTEGNFTGISRLLASADKSQDLANPAFPHDNNWLELVGVCPFHGPRASVFFKQACLIFVTCQVPRGVYLCNTSPSVPRVLLSPHPPLVSQKKKKNPPSVLSHSDSGLSLLSTPAFLPPLL